MAENNPTVFGKILRGELPCVKLYEDDEVLCFRDIRPVARHHSLVIPKRHVQDSRFLTPADAPLVQHMIDVGKKVLQEEDVDAGTAIDDGTASLGFHRWPLLTVHHLHMHVIHPLPCASCLHRLMHPQGYGAFYPSAESVLAQLREADSAL